VTIAAKLAAVVVAAGMFAGVSAASPAPRYVYRDIAFVTLIGHGTVTSTPRGLRCPKVCRAVYVRGTHVVLHATPAPGYRFAGFSSKWCTGSPSRCAFDLVSPHDCSGGACPLGAFGVRVHFLRAQNSDGGP
jgi:hypothetical protein